MLASFRACAVLLIKLWAGPGTHDTRFPILKPKLFAAFAPFFEFRTDAFPRQSSDLLQASLDPDHGLDASKTKSHGRRKILLDANYTGDNLPVVPLTPRDGSEGQFPSSFQPV